MRLPAREGVLEEVEHGEEFARRHEHVVAEPAGDDGVMHDGFVGLVFEVAVPARFEVWRGPGFHLAELVFGRADFYARVDAVCGQGAGALEVPFVEDGFLDLWNASDKVVEGLGIYMEISTI